MFPYHNVPPPPFQRLARRREGFHDVLDQPRNGRRMEEIPRRRPELLPFRPPPFLPAAPPPFRNQHSMPSRLSRRSDMNMVPPFPDRFREPEHKFRVPPFHYNGTNTRPPWRPSPGPIWPHLRRHRPMSDLDTPHWELQRTLSALQVLDRNFQRIISDGWISGIRFCDPWEEVGVEAIPLGHVSDIPEIQCVNQGKESLSNDPNDANELNTSDELLQSGEKSGISENPVNEFLLKPTDVIRSPCAESVHNQRTCPSIAESPSVSASLDEGTSFETRSLYNVPFERDESQVTDEAQFRKRVNSVPASQFSATKIRPRRGSDASTRLKGIDRGDPIVLRISPDSDSNSMANQKGLDLIPADFEPSTTAGGFRSRLNSFLRRNPHATSHEFPVFVVHESFINMEQMDNVKLEIPI